MNFETLRTAVVAIFPKLAFSGYIEPLLRVPPTYGIDTPAEFAAFLAHAGAETGLFSRFEENLNYSPEALARTWRRFAMNPTAQPADRIPNGLARSYAYNPIALGGYIYANRFGNGDEKSMDGWRYRGRGIMQHTFKTNYTRLQLATGQPLIAEPDRLLRDAELSVKCACVYWNDHALDKVDDDANAQDETRLINGGLNGLNLRQSLLTKLRVAFAITN